MTEHLNEVFQFLKSDREDVRKMAVSGLSQISAENTDLNSYIISHQTEAVATFLTFLDSKKLATLGDILTVLINTATDSGVSECYAGNGVVYRTMRLFESLESIEENLKSGESEDKKQKTGIATIKAFEELMLMLLNNLTASNTVAVQDFLQVDDEDLKGYFVSKLYVFYSRHPNECALYGETGSVIKNKEKEQQRDLRKWYLNICLNLTRTPEGQSLVFSEDWPKTLVEIIKETRFPLLRSLALQTFKNAASSTENHEIIAESSVISVVVSRLHEGTDKKFSAIQMTSVELIACMLTSVKGMEALESINTKKYLVEASRKSDSTQVVELDDNGNEQNNNVLNSDSAVFVQKHILPYLDDIQDAYVNYDD